MHGAKDDVWRRGVLIRLPLCHGVARDALVFSDSGGMMIIIATGEGLGTSDAHEHSARAN